VAGVDVESAGGGESDAALAARLPSCGAQRLRVLGPVSDALARAAHRAGITVDDTVVTPSPRVELPRWMREQSVSRTLHRHGRL
jgi:RHH-type proline utilization regulon transcriptional repressor/proline dehydrogenase/delta 1-pyrroline-5-carboxylate dehydrogenase